MKTLIAAAAVALSLTATPIANAQGPAAPAFCQAFHPTTHYITACAHGPGRHRRRNPDAGSRDREG